MLGFDGTTLRGVEGEVEIEDLRGREFDVRIERDESWLSGLLGGPLVIDGLVRGIVSEMHVSRMGTTTTMRVIGAERIQDVVGPRHVPPGVGDEAQAEIAPKPPAWLPRVCVAIHVPSHDGIYATGLVVSDSTNRELGARTA